MNKKSVVVVLYPGCIFFEIALAVELLAKKFEIIFATPDGADHRASNGAVLMAATSYAMIDLTNCKAILIPGGDPGSIKENQPIEKVIREASLKDICLAAICAGPSVLAKAGVLKGKRIAHGYGPKQLEFLKSYFVDVEITEEKFVADGKVLTAKPDAHIDFAVELACRLDCVDPSTANRTKDYYRGILGRKVRPLSLAIIENSKGQYLFHKGFDKKKNETFYRPLGGGVEFSESGQVALQREIKEELDLDASVSELKASFENIFTFDGHPGHEIIMLFSATFADQSAYERDELDIVESGVVVSKAVWRSVDEVRSEGSKLYPAGIDKILLGLGVN